MALLAEHFASAPDRLQAGLRGALSSSAVAERAGVSHTAISRLWPVADDDPDADTPMAQFLLEVVDHSSRALIDVDPLVSGMLDLKRQGATLTDLVQVLASVEIERLVDGDGAGEWLTFLGLAPYAMGEPVRSLWNGEDELAARRELARLYEIGLVLWDREMVPGLTTLDLANSLAALTDGIVLNHRVFPVAELDRVVDVHLDSVGPPPSQPWRLWAVAVMGIIDVMSRPVAAAGDEGQP